MEPTQSMPLFQLRKARLVLDIMDYLAKLRVFSLTLRSYLGSKFRS
jgi:hypothetical protein